MRDHFPDRHDEADALLKEMVQNWKAAPELRRYKVSLAELPTEDDGVSPGYRLAIHLPAGAAGVDLAETLPQRADWALLRLLLAQLGPKVESQTEGVRQQVHMAQPIDLRTAGDQWEAAAVSLEQQAEQLEKQAASTSGGETATLNASIQARIQAANLRHAVQNWRDLARDSYVRVSLTTPGGLVNAARTWQITVDSAPQMLDVAVESLSAGRVALAVAIALFLIDCTRRHIVVAVMSASSINPTTSAAPRVRPFHYRDSTYFQDGQWLTIVLMGLLYLILAAALDAAGHIENLAVVIPVTLGAFASGVLMSYSRFDGFFALSHSMFTGLAWILYMMAGAVTSDEIAPFLDHGINELQARVYFVLLRLLDWVDAAFSGSASGDNYVFIFEICFLMWWLTYLGTWAVFRHGYTWRAIVPAGVVLLINTYYAPQSTTPFLVAFILVGLLLLIRTNLAEQQLRWREQRVYFNQDIVWDFLRNGLVFSVFLVLVAWVVPGLGRNPNVREMLAPVNASWEHTAQNMQRLYQGLNRQVQQGGSSFGNNLALGGERNVTDELVFQVEADQARYWRAVTFDTFDGRQWLNTADAEETFNAGQIVPVASWRARKAISQTVTLLAPLGDVLFGAPDVAQADLRVKAQVRPQAGAAPIPAANAPPDTLPVEFAMLHASRDLSHGDRYTLISAVTLATVRDLQNAGADYPPEIVDRYVQLPPGFSPRVAELAKNLTANAITPYDKAKAIETYLRTIPYNDAIPAPPANVDPIEYFLFDLQQGYCDYYATAMAMMLRSVGVPACAVSGYAEGSYDEESRAYFVTERDAHTWVEVFFPEYGWIEFEPTAAESPLDRPTGDEQNNMALTSQNDDQADQPDDQVPDQPEQKPEDLPTPFTGEDLLQTQTGDTGAPYPWWVWALGVVLLLVVGAFFIWRARSSGPSAFTADLPVILFERMQNWAQRLGVGPATGQTPYEHARALGAALPEAQPYIEQITDNYVRFRFARQDVPAAAALGNVQNPALLQSWKQMETLFWKAWLRKLRNRFVRRQGSPYVLVNR